MNGDNRLPFAVPQALIDKLRQRGVGPGFFGKVTFHIERGEVIRTVTEANDVPTTGVSMTLRKTQN